MATHSVPQGLSVVAPGTELLIDQEQQVLLAAISTLLMEMGAFCSSPSHRSRIQMIRCCGPLGRSAGAQMGATLAISSSLDCHIDLSAEMMVTISCLKSAVAWIWTWCIDDWVTSSGLLVVFMCMAAVDVGVYGTTVVFYLYGKRVQIWVQTRDAMD
ncbi:uncharacterized protein BP01DRAFT_387953 [Aspergillus saccharolyticus JOP 1030-1]|uniref:Uncharacterized protein n=1 Tax=Aspergillus saccharolyticus JOP 1030-1 TaxID=1450539 RepID=A0A318ZZV5_9EURO|nr:hypothetical protein BP01DRAFT_387953 [Aspergillus saccharolyticus JOP 1030-1]PYH49803.1 hypothetical protein BP01DRAFT_387953 [Aspergillus saccharolyticus JOP 1030-1]